MAITHCAAAVPGLCAESRSGRDRSRQVLLSRCAQQSTRWCCPASAGHAALTLSRPRAPCLQRHGTRETAARPAPDAEGQCMDALGAAKYRGATAGAQRYVGAILRTRCLRACVDDAVLHLADVCHASTPAWAAMLAASMQSGTWQ
ncbi:hypothetical protein C7T79_09285 [Xanthomonas oryzae pv. oryzicola]|nr:hypothetical protein C7T79_09285 [Xanthomonas oryzae pv. oryzicola]